MAYMMCSRWLVDATVCKLETQIVLATHLIVPCGEKCLSQVRHSSEMKGRLASRVQHVKQYLFKRYAPDETSWKPADG